MLQKLLVVLVGLVMSVLGALSPAGLFASQTASEGDQLAANTAEEMLSTLRASDGQAFARVSVLWIEVDGRRVSEDAWGTGELEEIRFKVGVKDVDSVALAVGEKIVNLHPTDIITVRMFRGDFSYRGIGTPLASVQLQGTVKTTVLKEGDVSNRVLTQREGGLDLAGVRDANTQPGDDTKVAYVVLTTGEKVDTVAVEDGGARIYTEEATTASEAKNEPGNLLASWVKIDNRLVREYTWGDGAIKKIELEPAQAATRSVVLAFNGEVSEVQAGERVIIEDFVGEYLVYQVSGGMMRVRLDGYAGAFDTNVALLLPQLGGEGAPVADFDFLPNAPKSTDTLEFRDRSSDDGGRIVFWRWDFGDNTSTVLETPTHRYSHPGTYDVTLSITDNDLKTSSVSRSIVIRNSEPIADFDFSPKVVTTDTVVAFNDRSFDSDGTLASWSWDFGDGATSTARHPTHRFTHGGSITVTLTTTDELGGRTNLSKVVIVRNSPPTAGFSFSPASPATLDPIQFVNLSSDADGIIERWNWSFGDGTFGAGSAPVHAYSRPGIYTVTLTVFDDGGDSDTVSSTLMVRNRAPFPEFTWSPAGEPANVPVVFTSTSTDPDGRVLIHSWDFGDGSRASQGASVSHLFPRAGTYQVKLNVTDDTLGQDEIVRSVTIANGAPRANFATTPNPAYRASEVVFSDASSDPDGDVIVSWTWELGDGSVADGRVVRHAYSTVGPKLVNLTVRDEDGTTSTVSRTVRILNRAPTVMVDITPRAPTAGQTTTFTASGTDPDAPAADIRYEWRFSDGGTNDTPTAVRTFNTPGEYSVTLRGHDADGGVSSPIALGISVQPARPSVGFSWTPLIPLKDKPVQFHDDSLPAPDAPISEWRWTFSADPGANSPAPNPQFTYVRNGTFDVTLTVTDIHGQSNTTTRAVHVNLPPSARFTVSDETLDRDQAWTTTDASIDDDGAIVNWTWDMGDGTTSWTRHPDHAGFATPGVYQVNLTVRDNDGGTDVESRRLSVANRAPTAKWNVSTLNLPQERGVPFYFYSDESSDPDGQDLVSWSWSFGDGTTSGAADPSHTFQRSGPHLVGLSVNDGISSSPRTSVSHQFVNVQPNHPVRLQLSAVLPGDRVADLSRPEYTISIRSGSTNFVDAVVVREGVDMNVTIDKPYWYEGKQLTLHILAPFLSQPSEQVVTLHDGLDVIPLTFPLRLNVNSALMPFVGTNPTILPPQVQQEIGSADNVSGDPVYRDMREKPSGTGWVRFSDGTPAALADVTIEARWVPVRSASLVRDDPTASQFLNSGLLGWCPVAFARSGSNGDFDWTFDGQRVCVTNSLSQGVYPLGRWEIRARPALDPQHLSPVRGLYVDPTGGVLMSALQGLA